MNYKKQQSGFTLIEILVVIGMIAILATIVLIAINPAKQFRQGRDTQRTSNVNAILNAVGQYLADHKGTLPPSLGTPPLAKSDISKASINLCPDIVPTYIPALPADPSVATGSITDCTTAYDTKYNIAVDANGRVTVSADKEDPPPAVADGISVTR